MNENQYVLYNDPKCNPTNKARMDDYFSLYRRGIHLLNVAELPEGSETRLLSDQSEVFVLGEIEIPIEFQEPPPEIKFQIREDLSYQQILKVPSLRKELLEIIGPDGDFFTTKETDEIETPETENKAEINNTSGATDDTSAVDTQCPTFNVVLSGIDEQDVDSITEKLSNSSLVDTEKPKVLTHIEVPAPDESTYTGEIDHSLVQMDLIIPSSPLKIKRTPPDETTRSLAKKTLGDVADRFKLNLQPSPEVSTHQERLDKILASPERPDEVIPLTPTVFQQGINALRFLQKQNCIISLPDLGDFFISNERKENSLSYEELISLLTIFKRTGLQQVYWEGKALFSNSNLKGEQHGSK